MKHVLIVCLLLLELTASCQKNTASPTRGQKHFIRLNVKGEPATLDPRKGGDVISSHMHFLLFEGLVRLNADGSISPSQAESYEISSDGLIYTFHLRHALWSDGTMVNAYDFEKSWKDILNPNFPSLNAHLLYPIKNAERAKKGCLPLSDVGIQAQDAKTLIVTLEKPTPYFLDLISFCVFFPVNSKLDKEHPDWAYHAGPHFTSNGPFVLQGWKHNNEIIAIRNPYYWDKSRVLPDQIHFSMIDNETTALEMFENGALDMIGEPLCPLPVDAIASLKKENRLFKHPSAETTIITFNVTKPPFSNAKIRKAFGYAINRKDIVNNITQCDEQIATGAIPTILKGNRKHDFFIDNDVVTARKLLKEGMLESRTTYEDFKKIVLHYPNSDINNKIAQALQQQWAETLGISIHLENLDLKVLMDKLTKRDFAMAQFYWAAQYNDQMNILERFKFKENVKNYSHWENPDYIQLLDTSFYQTGEERLATLEKAEEIFLNEMPIAPIYHWDMSYMICDELDNVKLTSIGDVVFESLNMMKKKGQR
jgi:oligopeptide transport system substrate-binding protein